MSPVSESGPLSLLGYQAPRFRLTGREVPYFWSRLPPYRVHIEWAMRGVLGALLRSPTTSFLNVTVLHSFSFSARSALGSLSLLSIPLYSPFTHTSWSLLKNFAPCFLPYGPVAFSQTSSLVEKLSFHLFLKIELRGFEYLRVEKILNVSASGSNP